MWRRGCTCLNVGLLRLSFDPIHFVLVSAEFDPSSPLGCMLTACVKISFFPYYLTVSSKAYRTSAFISVSAHWPLHVSYPANSFPLLKGLVLYFQPQAMELEWQSDFWHTDPFASAVHHVATVLQAAFTACFRNAFTAPFNCITIPKAKTGFTRHPFSQDFSSLLLPY